MVVIATISSCVFATALWAHAEFLRSSPEPNSVLPQMPRTVQIWFSEPIEAPPDAIAVYSPEGVRVDGGDGELAENDPTSMVASVSGDRQGTYTVRWRAVSADGHPIGGTFTFSVGVPSEVAELPSIDGGVIGLPLQAAARWVHLLGMTAALGPLILMLLVLPPDGHSDLERRCWKLAKWGALALVPAALLSLASQSVDLHGSLAAGLGPGALGGLLGTRWGQLWIARLGLAAAIVWVAWLGSRASGGSKRLRRPLWTGIGIGAVLTVFTSMNGHSGATEPVWLSLTVDWFHLGATFAWVGGLFTLVLAVLPESKAWAREETAAFLRRVVPRFSIMAIVSVELLVLTGLYHTWAHVDGPANLVEAPYGLSLLVKLGLIACLMVPAAFNHLVVRPGLLALGVTGSPGPGLDRLVHRFSRSLATESGIGVVVLAAVGILTSLPPAEARSRPTGATDVESQPAVTVAQNAGPLLVTLELDPANVGSNEVRVMVQDETGKYLQDRAVRVRLVPEPKSGVSPSSAMMAPDQRGFRATVGLSPAGRWGIQVLVDRALGMADTASFELSVPVYGAAELLAFADQTMNRLRSLVETVETSSGEYVTVETSSFAAPDRWHRQELSPGDAEDVLIGEVRHMRHGTMWHAESVEPFEWPAYDFTHHATDVLLIGRDSLSAAEAFVVGYVDTQTGSRNRIWISTTGYRVLQHTSMAPGRFVRTVYTRFNKPVVIRPPT